MAKSNCEKRRPKPGLNLRAPGFAPLGRLANCRIWRKGKHKPSLLLPTMGYWGGDKLTTAKHPPVCSSLVSNAAIWIYMVTSPSLLKRVPVNQPPGWLPRACVSCCLFTMCYVGGCLATCFSRSHALIPCVVAMLLPLRPWICLPSSLHFTS
jgi:hypothetical protein